MVTLVRRTSLLLLFVASALHAQQIRNPSPRDLAIPPERSSSSSTATTSALRTRSTRRAAMPSRRVRSPWKKFYLDAIANLKPGLSEIIVHLGHDDGELRAVTVNHPDYGAAWRQRDYDVVTSAEFKKALGDNRVVLVSWRGLQKAARQP